MVQKRESKAVQKVLLFRLQDKRRFGIGTLKVREILPFRSLAKLPQSHPSVLGTLNFRGSTVPVIDTSLAVGRGPLSKEQREAGSIIVADVQRRQTGFLVGGVDSIIETNWKGVLPPPKALGDRAFVTGLLDVSGELIQLMDVELLLAGVFPDDQASHEVTLTAVQTETLRAMNILLVDDSAVARKQLSDVLDRKDISYQVTTSGDEALEILLRDNEQGQPVDILVSDIEMPGLDGYELTFNVRDNRSLKQPYIILHTSLNSEMSLSYANQVGANEALTKFDAEELLQAMLRSADERPQG